MIENHEEKAAEKTQPSRTASKAQLIEQLCNLTKRWNEYELVPASQQSECREIGVKLDKIGGIGAMRDGYYEAKARNRAASSIQPYWDDVGDWRW